MHLHILGICGTFMGGIAALARAAGHRVTGSDKNVYPPMSDELQSLGITVADLDDPRQFEPAPDCVIVGNVMSRGMPAVETLLNSGLLYQSGPEWLAQNILSGKWVLAVAGTHGKTTTAAILAWLLEVAGMDPGFLIGGVPANFSTTARLGGGRFFVIEADEYDTAFFDKRSKFVHYRPRTLILNNLEFDHVDIFPNLAAIETQFHHLVRTVPGEGLILRRTPDAALERVLSAGCWTPVETFGVDGVAAKWRAWADNGKLVVEVDDRDAATKWTHPGRHNRENALAAVAAAGHAGVPVSVSVDALGRFQGVKRRLESVGAVAGVEVFDDFAHHPTAIASTLAAVHDEWPGGRVIAVLEPRSNTMRSGVHAAELARALAKSDAVWIYRPADMRWDPAVLGESLPALHVCESYDDLVRSLTGALRRGDRVIVMSNGGFGGIHGQLLDALRAAA